MADMKARLPDGSEGVVHDEAFSALREDWNEYQLEDGTIVRVKIVIASIARVLDTEGRITRNQEGVQNAVVRHATLVHVVDPSSKTPTN